MATERKTLKECAYHELKEFLIIFFYLWLFLGIFAVYKSIILAEHSIDYVAHGVALVNALVLGKFMLIVKSFQPMRHADDTPLVYPTLLGSAIFALVLMVLKILEDAAVGSFHGKSFVDSIADLSGGSWRAILAFAAIMFVAFIPLTAFFELQRALGEGRLTGLFLRSRSLSKQIGRESA